MMDISTFPDGRPLTPDERSLIEWLIEHGDASADSKGQVAEARVVGRCRCGCPTVDLWVQGINPNVSEKAYIVADFIGETREGWRVGVLLWERGRTLSCLEVYNLSEHEGPFGLPVIGTLKPFLRPGTELTTDS